MVGSMLPAAGRDWHYNCSARCMIDLNYAPAPPMDPSEIYAKTELGLAELRDRKLNLPITLRGLLILIDGNRTVAQVLVKARALKLDERAMTALERGGLIAKRFSAPSVAQNDATIAPAQRSEDEVERYMQAQQMMSDRLRRDQRPSRIQGLRPDDAVAEDSERPRPARSVAGFRQILGQAPRPRAGDADRLVDRAAHHRQLTRAGRRLPAA